MRIEQYDICPRCSQDTNAYEQELAVRVDAEYGSTPAEEWLELHSELKQLQQRRNFVPVKTLYEEVSGYVTNGILFVEYTAKCTVCDYRRYTKTKTNVREENASE